MLRMMIKLRCRALSDRRIWTAHDSFSLCRSLNVIAGDGRIDWARAGLLMDVLNGCAPSLARRRLGRFLSWLVAHRYARWDGREVRCSDYPRGWNEWSECRRALAAIR